MNYSEGAVLRPNVPQAFFDDLWVAESRRLVRRWLPAKVYPYPVLEADRAAEGAAIVLYGSVLPEPAGGWRMYYSNFVPGVTYDHGAPNGPRPATFLARSHDGLAWRRPDLDDSHREPGAPGNVVYQRGTHWDSPSVMYDPTGGDKPWKMIAFAFDSIQGESWTESWGMVALESADGIHWEPNRSDGLPNLQAGDRSNLFAEKVDGEYWLYTRHRHMVDHVGARAVYLSRSRDFVSWTEPVLVLAPDLTDEPDVEFYGMSVFRRGDWFIGLLEYWRSDMDCIDVHLAYSRDGRNWQRPAPHVPFIAATYPWNAKWSSCASNGPIVLGEQMVFYFGGRWTSHHYDSAHLHGAIGYASLPIDHFCALEGLDHGGQFTTPTFVWPGGDLAINADTRESYDAHPGHCKGEITVEVLGPDGLPLPQWSGADRAVFKGNTHCRGRALPGTIRWPNDQTLATLTGQPIALRFHLRHARLFTFTAS